MKKRGYSKNLKIKIDSGYFPLSIIGIKNGAESMIITNKILRYLVFKLFKGIHC